MNEEEIEKVADEIERVVDDDSVPQNVSDTLQEALGYLRDEDLGPSERAASAMNVLNDASNEPNLPTHIRTLIWNVSGELETATTE
ncbi:MAG: UPF0147 family protein [Halobacteriales archaeon]|nr:UPF0147 family protein [Halobacteriales archaeon]